jgi:hypothetical protein
MLFFDFARRASELCDIEGWGRGNSHEYPTPPALITSSRALNRYNAWQVGGRRIGQLRTCLDLISVIGRVTEAPIA